MWFWNTCNLVIYKPIFHKYWLSKCTFQNTSAYKLIVAYFQHSILVNSTSRIYLMTYGCFIWLDLVTTYIYCFSLMPERRVVIIKKNVRQTEDKHLKDDYLKQADKVKLLNFMRVHETWLASKYVQHWDRNCRFCYNKYFFLRFPGKFRVIVVLSA